MQTIKSSAIVALLSLAGFALNSAEPPEPASLQRLIEGNAGLVSGQTAHPHQDGTRGAVTATVGVLNGDPAPANHIASIVEAIKPTVQAVGGRDRDAVENAVRENVHEFVEKMKASAPVLEPLVKSGELRVVGARYDIDDGKVEFVP